MSSIEFQVSNVEYRMSSIECQILHVEYRMSSIFLISVFYTALVLRGTRKKERLDEKLFADSLSVQFSLDRLDYLLITAY